MNRNIIQAYISEYKANFSLLHNREIYKWKAVKCFQDNWDLNSKEFADMLVRSLRLTKNLLDSGKYFPHRMIAQYAVSMPEEVRVLFRSLYDESVDLITRMQIFMDGMNDIHKRMFKDRISYQDSRAIIVYLTLKFPERYYFYKFEMFKLFTLKMQLAYVPVKGRLENIGQFNNLCEIVRYELCNDQELIKMHVERLGNDCYLDTELNILTQDFIYAVTNHLNDLKSEQQNLAHSISVQTVLAKNLALVHQKVRLKGAQINFAKNNVENKLIGDLGELWVLEYEALKLKKFNQNKRIHEIEHTSKNIGDGTGFDIKSFDENGGTIFIEVKTTSGGLDAPFFITRNELEKSKQTSESYLLYRVYNFDWSRSTADLLIIKGDLENLCDFPTNFKVQLDAKKL